MFRRHNNHTRVEILRFKVQRAREAGRAASMLDEHETEIIATFQRRARAVQQEIDVTLVGLGREKDDDAAACARRRERSLHGDLERMIWRGEYAPVSCLGWTIAPGQSAFDEFDGKLSDPFVNAGGMCFCVRVAVRALRARSGLQGLGDFREGCVCVVSRGRWRWKIEAAGCFGHELGHADRVQVKVVKQSAFVLNGSDGEFKPLCHKSSHNFEWGVSLRLDSTSSVAGISLDCSGEVSGVASSAGASSHGLAKKRGFQSRSNGRAKRSANNSS